MQKQGDARIVKEDEKIWLKEDNIKKVRPNITHNLS